MIKNIYSFDEHTFFDDLVTMIMSLSSYMFTLHVAIQSNNPVAYQDRSLSEWLNYIKPLKNPEFPFSLFRNYDNNEIIFFPFDIISHISLSSWPQFIEYNISSRNINDNDKKFSIDSSINKKMVIKLVGSSFISYYQSQLDFIESKFGKDKKKWPDILNFARHIRNGFAHNAKINIPNINSPKVSWGIWEIDSNNHNYDVLFSEKGLNVGDVILLMEKLDLFLKS